MTYSLFTVPEYSVVMSLHSSHRLWREIVRTFTTCFPFRHTSLLIGCFSNRRKKKKKKKKKKKRGRKKKKKELDHSRNDLLLGHYTSLNIKLIAQHRTPFPFMETKVRVLHGPK